MNKEETKKYFEQENGIDKIYIINDSKHKKFIEETTLNGAFLYKTEEYVCVDTQEETYNRELKQIELIRKSFNITYPYIYLLHINEYNLLIKNSTYKVEKEIIPENNIINKDIKKRHEDKTDLIKSNIESKESNSNIESSIYGSMSGNESLEKKESLKLENINNLDNIEIYKKNKSKESSNILNKVIKDFYRFYNKLLPEIKNNIVSNFKNINDNIIKKHILNMNNIIQYYEIFKSFKISCKHISSKNFYTFIEYDKYNYCSNYYNINQFYDKCKRCHDFISFFDSQKIIHEHIIELIYKSNLTYTKIFKIRGDDYKELKSFFLDKISIIKKTNNEPLINEITLKHNNNKETLLNYYGSKHNFDYIINKHIEIKKESKIFDLFSGSCSISYNLNKLYPNNKIITNDNNRLLNNFYNVLKINEMELLNKIEELNTIENIKNYKLLKDKINNCDLSELETAAIYYILNKIAFNGNMYFDKNNNLYISSKSNKSKLIIDKNKFSNFSMFLNNI